MNPFKKILENKHRTFIIYAVVVFLVFFILLCIGHGNNLLHWFDAKREIANQEQQIEMYIRENAEMDRRIEMLSNDRDSLERFARESFHFCAPGDDVYIIEE